MNEEALFQTTAIIDIDEEIRKEEEILNTIKMEPILETTEIDEEVTVVKKQKRVRFIDYVLIAMIFLVSAAFLFVVIRGL